MVRVPPGELVPPEVVDAQLVPRAASDDPLEVFKLACDERSRPTMVARLQAAARILQAGADASTYPWATLDHVAVLHVLAKLDEAGASPATRNLTRAALRKMGKVLFGMRLMSVDERQRIDDVPPIRGKRLPRGRSLTDRDLRKLFRACARDTSPAGRRDAALIAVLYGGGLRRDEASQLDVADAGDAALRVQGKGEIERMQPVGADVVQAIRTWLEVRGNVTDGDGRKPLFLVVDKFGRVKNRRLDGAAIAWKLARRAEQAGIEPLDDGHTVSPHDLRRSFVTTLLDKGEDLSTVAKAARHASVATTSIYDRRDERKVAEAVAKLSLPIGR